MGKRNGYELGTFSWLDLSTGEADGARAFYGELLAGPMEPGMGKIAIISDPQGAMFESETDE